MPVHRRNLEDSLDGASIETSNTIELKELFNHGRWKKPFTFRHVLFALYLPFGLAFWPFRLLLNVVVFSLLLIMPKSFRVSIRPLICVAMGIVTRIRGRENVPRRGDPNAARIVVSNHISDFDPYPVFMFLDYFHCLVAAHISKVPIIGSVYRKFDGIYVDQTDRNKARQDVLDALEHSDIPLVLYPEGGLTSGDRGMMMFQKFVFGLGHGVVPIAMKIVSPWPVNVDYINSSWFKNFFWWILVPYNVFDLHILPVQRIQENETDADFAKRVQTLIATDLQLEATNHPYAKKKELAKELLQNNNKKI
ncbi:hypothetical protein PPL_07277 [Heterostelium album PN500]|uniref:Phospholipid/glycerol acyltransferase domain-containing protein n=1 Tax=Heterostelium pallidum (strain ATCC 26659 / Pp 5 / PN500) TaxID=670386 RepID=D3BEW1_HETP5|nr:hypothetical protein PPL_07277 [Heterostelium album PN500]EFA80442.1 hypothetical protein PPL_07277 [Heterostelium album PN500]|eukprot:XP_020432562.1 hypothetical protein PPL_07277 [Heterostelium album PN500]